ncbi:ABC transporter permease [Oscillibacter valericigenes]|uniref:ABC transporter permease n=1 Tax=Oscillibacter valericigenes TaxID=351091 RepID=UPI001F2B33A8|nr:ABC transporter permease [Oscillibacter valericigenes]MCF2663455.1 ABC transporter permease [Oscillibacter valericigenes]
MNLQQAVKMAWKSIWGKKGRSALTILGIFIGIAAVMTIVSVMEGMKLKTMEQFEAMGSNRITVSIYSWMYDEEGNDISRDYFPDLYDYCNGLKEYVLGVTPTGRCDATVSYGTKSTANMQYQWDEMGNLTGDMPPSLYYGSDQYAACNNLTIARGRDLALLDIEKYNQVCVLGAQAAKTFFGSADPVGKELSVDGNKFLVAGVYTARLSDESADQSWLDNFIVFPYTARRLLGGDKPTEFLVKARSSEAMTEAISRLSGFLKGLVDQNTGGYNVYSESQWQEQSNEYLSMIGLVLGGIAAISLAVGGIGIMNIMLVTVTERTREIGIRRAIGAQRSSIVAQFLIEAAMLCGIGGIIGILFGTAGSVILSNLLLQMTIFPPVKVTVGAFALSVALGIIFGSYPAAKASKLQPVEALRAE